MSKKYEVKYIAIPEIPLIKEGDDIGKIIAECCKRNKIDIQLSIQLHGKK